MGQVEQFKNPLTNCGREAGGFELLNAEALKGDMLTPANWLT